MTAPTLKLGYLISQYPAANHTFILREIDLLRKLGYEIAVASISDPDRSGEAMTELERQEVDRTFYVKRQGARGAFRAALGAFIRKPTVFLSAFVFALKLSGGQPRRLVSYVYYFIEALIVSEWARVQRIEHIHTHFSSTIALIATRLSPAGFSATVHGPGEFDNPSSFHLGLKVKLFRFVVAISSYGKSQLMRWSSPSYTEKIHVAPLGVDPDIYVPAPEREVTGTFEIICVGRLAPVKAQSLLIDAVSRLNDVGRNVRLRLVGDGPDRQELERKVQDLGIRHLVVFDGWKNQTEVLRLYREANLFALASFAEGVPVVLMEAMAMAVPCVATRINGIPELIRDRIDGLLVTPGSVEELANAIAELMDDTGLCRQFGQSGRQRVIDKYNLAHNVTGLGEIFERQLQPSRLVSESFSPVPETVDSPKGLSVS
jgi:colanic acid/amylovoran biosynthesis glycosyltransferase